MQPRVINKQYVQRILDDLIIEQQDIYENQKEVTAYDRKHLSRSLLAINKMSVSCHLMLDLFNGTK